MLIKPVRDEYIIARDLTFHYIQWGSHGSPIICIHGITANAFCFQAFAYDLRGQGDSYKPENGYSIPLHAANLAELIAAEIRYFIEKE